MDKTRLNKIKGQISGIEKMLDDGRACMDVVQQIAAVRAALSKFGVEILKDEMSECVNKKDEKVLEEIVDKLFKIT